MAIRFSMSEDTSIISLKSTGRNKSCTKDQVNDLTQIQPQNNYERARDSNTQTTYKCSNIRAMQIFYEMKQEFPNIPDDVVNQHVLANIHDPENCKAKLNIENNSCFASVQSYPQQLLRVCNRDSLLKKKSISNSSKTLSNSQNIDCKNHSDKEINKNCPELPLLNEAAGISNQNSFNQTRCKQISTPDVKDMRSGFCSIHITTCSTDKPKKRDTLEKDKLTLPSTVSQRPNTLNIKNDLQLSQTKNRGQLSEAPKSKISNGSVCSPLTPQAQKMCKSINTVTTIQSPTVYTDLGKSEILVNVSLSPGSHRNRAGGTQRYQSIINVRPELPFTRNLESSTSPNHKSYTSVNLVLRQPSTNPQSPIDITVGPNLTYSSSSYHARFGYQSNYQITVTDECGVFSAFRISPINYNSSKLSTLDKGDCDNCETHTELDDDSGNCSSLQNSILKPNYSNEQSDARDIILRQQEQKDRISEVIRKNKNKLNLVHKEVDFAMQTEANDRVSDILDREIGKLRCDCQTMLNEIENSKTNGLREDCTLQTSSIERRQTHSFPRYRALRYPASISTNNCIRNQQRSFPNEFFRSRGDPTISHADENSNFGAGD